MLTHLSLHNFKTWESADLQFGKITGLFGTNSSGKSSLIQFLLLLKQTKDATDRNTILNLNSQYVNLGLYKDLIYNHEDERSLAWNLSFRRFDDLVLRASGHTETSVVTRGRDLTVKAEVREAGKPRALVCTDLQYEIGDMEFRLTHKEGSETSFDLTANPTDNFRFIRNQGRAWQVPGPVKSYAFPDQARTYFQNASFLADLEKSYEEQMDELFYLGPLREYPSRDYLWARSRPVDVGVKGEKTVDAILAMTNADERRNVAYRHRLRPFQEIISYWLSELGVIHDFRVVEIAKDSNRWQAKVSVRDGGPPVLLTDVGVGVSQVLPVITLLQYVPEGATVILEQPEIHLHPLAQANLADVIVNAALHRGVQVVLESHSEHLLLRLQTRLAEEQISTDDVKLYFCHAPRGSSIVEPLTLDLLGNIENWPDKFMGDAFGEAATAERARLRRMKAAE